MSISCVAAMGSFLFGFDTGVINGTMGGLRLAFDANLFVSSFNIASMLLGCAIGAFYSGRLSDIFGRRTMLIVAAILFIISAGGSGIADSSNVFIFYRLIGGLAVGSASVLVPMYIAEIAPAHYRGAYGTLQQLGIVIGFLVVYISNYLLVSLSGTSINEFWFGYETWRWMIWGELLPACIFFMTLFWIPESPRYLVVKGKNTQALKVLIKLYGQFLGEAKLLDISMSLSSDHAPRLSDLKSHHTGKVRRIVWIGLVIAVLQQLMGINVIFYYGSVLWELVGFSELNALFLNIVVASVGAVGCICMIFLVDLWGRRPLLKLGSIILFITLFIIAFIFFNVKKDVYGVINLGDYKVLTLVLVNVYVFFFNLSWGPVMWIMLGEMFPNQIRGSALAVTGFMHWITNFIIIMSFPLLLRYIGLAGVFSLYGLFALISTLFVFYYLTETKDKELEELI